MRIAHISQVQVFVTDRLPSARLRAVCATHGVEIVETSAEMATPEMIPEPRHRAILCAPLSSIIVNLNYNRKYLRTPLQTAKSCRIYCLILPSSAAASTAAASRAKPPAAACPCSLRAGRSRRGTSSASTKLIHGGLRYLEYYEFRLVREALQEREVLWRMAPHIVRPLRFVLPHHAGLRPAWLLRLGLFLYDHLGGRSLLAGTRSVRLRQRSRRRAAESPLHAGFRILRLLGRGRAPGRAQRHGTRPCAAPRSARARAASRRSATPTPGA